MLFSHPKSFFLFSKHKHNTEFYVDDSFILSIIWICFLFNKVFSFE